MATQSNSEENMNDIRNHVDNLKAEIDSLKGDIAVFKQLIPPPKGFTDWEHFDKVVNSAYESQFEDRNA